MPRHHAISDIELAPSGGGTALIVTALFSLAVLAFLIHTGFPLIFCLFLGLPALLIAILVGKGLVTLTPNHSLVCLLFGRYVGTVHQAGLWWVNPFYTRRDVSRRLVTSECGPLKVNDAVGNPIDIGAVIVWRVDDAARALLEVHAYRDYVQAQTEAALRRMASLHPYDHLEAEAASDHIRVAGGARPAKPSLTLRDGGDALIALLLEELATRMEAVGVAIIEARISHLAYSAEIAGVMLRRQAASAMLAARRLVVRGAVDIVAEALGELERRKLSDALDSERKAAMVSNLLVVLVGDQNVAPVINAGTLYS